MNRCISLHSKHKGYSVNATRRYLLASTENRKAKRYAPIVKANAVPSLPAVLRWEEHNPLKCVEGVCVTMHIAQETQLLL